MKDDLSTTGGAMTAAPDGEIIQQPTAQETGVTPAQAKTDAIAALTLSAYARASQLVLTPEEAAKLQADFPDEAFRPGAAGKENLIYLEHAYIRDRLNNVFGPGAWSLIPRNRWVEQFETKGGDAASKVYVEAMMCIRGCFVAEAIGDMDYYPKNAATNYGDAVEGAKSAALRRCAKELGMGLQAWKKGWTEGWWARRRAPKGQTPPPPQSPPPKPTPADPAKPNDAIVAILTTASKGGLGDLQKAWEMLTIPQKRAHKELLKKLKVDALARDQAVEGLGDAHEGP